MTHRAVIIVSETVFLRQALEHALMCSFSSVSILESIERLSPGDEWGHSVVIIDTIDLKATVAALQRLSARHDLHRVMLLVKSHHTLDDLQPILLKLGAVMPSSSTVEDIRHVAQAVHRGVVVLPLSLLADLGALQAVDAPLHPGAPLTDRERDVLELVSQGYSNKIIAHRLLISDSTVRVHIRAILRKLMLKSRTEAALLAAGRFRPEARAGLRPRVDGSAPPQV